MLGYISTYNIKIYTYVILKQWTSVQNSDVFNMYRKKSIRKKITEENTTPFPKSYCLTSKLLLELILNIFPSLFPYNVNSI